MIETWAEGIAAFFAWLLASLGAYALFGFIVGNWNPLEWHWAGRVVFVLILLGILEWIFSIVERTKNGLLPHSPTKEPTP